MDTARHQVTNHLTIESNFDNGELAILATDKKLAVRRYDWLATQPDNPLNGSIVYIENGCYQIVSMLGNVGNWSLSFRRISEF